MAFSKQRMIDDALEKPKPFTVHILMSIDPALACTIEAEGLNVVSAD